MSIRSFVGRLAAIASALTVITYVAALFLSVAILFPTLINLDLFHHDAILVLGAFLVETRAPLQFNALTGYFVTFLVYLACFVIAFRTDDGVVAGLRKIAKGALTHTPNWFAVMPLASSALLLLVVVITAIQTSAGLPTGSLPQNPAYQMLYGLAYAPIVEEIAYRISVLGTLVATRVLWNRYQSHEPAVLLSFSSSIRLFILGYVAPDRAKAEAGLPRVRTKGLRGIHPSEWILLFVTSAGFGLAHLFANSGWQVGKVLTAAIQGFAIGFAYLAYGAYAAILFHWLFDVYFYVLTLTSSGLADIVSLLVVATGILGYALLLVMLFSKKAGSLGLRLTNGLYLANSKQSTVGV